jgi:hypothetical protein
MTSRIFFVSFVESVISFPQNRLKNCFFHEKKNIIPPRFYFFPAACIEILDFALLLSNVFVWKLRLDLPSPKKKDNGRDNLQVRNSLS